MSDQYPQVRVWHDDKWTMVWIHNGVDCSTVSLTRPQAALLRQQLVPPEAKPVWDSHGDGGESERLNGLTVGHSLTYQDARDLAALLQDFNDEIQNSANVYHDGYVAAMKDIGGEALVNAEAEVRQALADRGVRQLLKAFAHRAGRIDRDKP